MGYSVGGQTIFDASGNPVNYAAGNYMNDIQRYSGDKYKDNPFNINDPAERAKAVEWAKSKEKNLIDKAGAPTIPGFQKTTADGKILPQYQLNPGKINFNQDLSAINEIKNRALSQGPSAWLNLQLEKQASDEASALDKAKREGAGNAATAEANLAMRGGLSGGARERLARSSAINNDLMGQNIHGEGANQRIGLQTQDETNKLGLLKDLPGMITQAQGQNLDVQKYNTDQDVGAQKYNIGNALNDVLQKRLYDSNKYSEEMKAWAAGKTADAQGGGGKK